MTRGLCTAGLALLVATGAASAQTAAPNASFVTADVHVRPHSSNPNLSMSGGVLRGERFDLRNATMLDLISMSYGADPTLVDHVEERPTDN